MLPPISSCLQDKGGKTNTEVTMLIFAKHSVKLTFLKTVLSTKCHLAAVGLGGDPRPLTSLRGSLDPLVGFQK